MSTTGRHHMASPRSTRQSIRDPVRVNRDVTSRTSYLLFRPEGRP